MVPVARFAVRFDPIYRRLAAVLLLPPADAWVKVSGGEVEVRMAWAFRARFPRAVVAAAANDPGRPISRGVHGWGGRWLVNGDGEGIVRLTLSPPQRGRVLGFPVRLRELRVSVEDPAGLRAALGR
jgi:hypothetical protein